MPDQSNADSNNSAPGSTAAPSRRRGGLLVLALVAVAVVAGLTGNMLTTAFGQGFAWHVWRDGGFAGGFMSGPLTEAQIDDRIDRVTKHLAIELDATSDQQMKIASIAKAAVTDLLPMREKAQAARRQAVGLLTAPTVDRAAIEKLRADQIALADAASKRIVQAADDASEVLNPEQRRKIADWLAVLHEGGGPWMMMRWHNG
ncbi:MAG TPA: Spy/CpxP family protein refolding chaperone [Xanthobacteraceae bacterium]|nr:Spy/CpxP family protein refolding chaperone [Xanthobacteraceae bacterium]